MTVNLLVPVILGKRPSKRKNDDPKPAPNPKRQKIKAVPPPVTATIINLDDDDIYADPPVPAPSTTTTTSTSTEQSLSTPTNASSTSSQLSAQSGIPTHSTDSTADHTDVSASIPPPPVASSPSGSVEPSGSAEPAGSVKPSGNVEPLTPTLSGTASSITSNEAPGQSLNSMEQNVAANGPTRCSRRQTTVLDNLDVPRPQIEVPLLEQTLALTAQDANARKRATKGDAKELQISAVLSAHGLYATEYKKEHSHITVGEYRAIWDGLDNKTRKIYERLSRVKKAEKNKSASATDIATDADK